MKFQSIQLLRGFAVLLVMVHHFMSPYYHFQHTNIVGDFFSNYGSFGVDLFFVISGFIMSYILYTTKRDFKIFLLNRVIRIVPNYWFWTTVVLVIGIKIDTLFIASATLESVVMSLFFISHDHPSALLSYYPTLTVGWTLNLEMFFYFFISIILLFNMKTKTNILTIAIILILLPFIYSWLGVNFYNSVFGNARLAEFSFGIFIAILWFYYNNFLHNKLHLFLIICILSLIAVSLAFIPVHILYKFIILAPIVVFLTLLLENYIASHKNKFYFILWLGEISFSLYLVHAIVIRTLFYYFGQLDTSLEVFFAFSLSIIFSVSIAYIAHAIIEVKLTYLLKNILYKKESINDPI